MTSAKTSLAIFFLTGLPGLATQEPSKKDLPAFYGVHCSVCHGADGSARGADGSRLKGQDFTNAREMKDFTDAELARTIHKGKLFGRMPSFKDRLSEAEIMELVRQIVRKAEKGKVIAPEVTTQ